MQKNKIKIHLPHITSESLFLGILLAIVGGFLDAYTFIGRDGVFANAQTGNIVLVGISALKGDWTQTLLQALPILAFIVGVIVAENIKKTSSILFIKNSERAILILEIGLLFIIGFIPNNISNVFVTVTISFVASLQTSSFRKLVDSPYATTMCTGNLRSASQAAYIAFTKKDRESALKAFRYFIIIFSFLFGAFLGGFLTLSIGAKAVWGAVIILICSLILLNIDER
jgi:Predicted membrane protein